jgi:phage minor structural protein
VETTPLYSSLPYYTKAKTPVDEIKENPSAYTWNSGTMYSTGTYVVYGGSIWVAHHNNSGIVPGDDEAWTYVSSVSSSGGGSSGGGSSVYHEGKVAEQIPGGQTIVFIADYNSTYFRARSLRGATGYIRRNDCEQGTIAGQKIVIEPRMITEQVFRIYNVEIDSENQIVTVNARHKSYDYAGNTMMDCNVTEADANTAIAIMQGCLLNEDTRSIVCNIENGSITKDWSWQNPIYALLEPDEGIVPILKGKLIRDNDDFFILDNSNPRTGITLRYGVNLLGVTWSRSTEDVITRILPRGKNKDDTDLFLEELYIDSANIDDFPVVRVEVLDCDCKVGQQIEHADGTKQTLTEQDCYAKMREEAHKRFDTDKVDAVTVSLEVEFLLVGDTEEYKQYKGLQKVRMYDKIRIDHGLLGLDSTVQVSGYTFDAIMRRFKKITLGDVFSYGGRTVAGYNVNNGAITYQKLSPGLVKRIKSSE